MKKRRSMVFKVVSMSLLIVVPIIVFMSVYDLNTFIDKAVLYLENKLLREKVRVHERISSLMKYVDGVVSDAIEKFATSGEVGEYEDIKSIKIVKSGQQVEGEGFRVERKFALDGELYSIYVYVDPKAMKEIIRDESGKLRIIVADSSGNVVLPEEMAGQTLKSGKWREVVTLGRLFEILRKYDIRIVRIGEKKFYLMRFMDPFFSGYRVYIVIDYEEAASEIKRNIVEALFLDLSVIFGVGLLVFLYVRNLTLPIEKLIEALRRNKEEGRLEEIDVGVKSEELQDLVDMVNELLISVRKSLEDSMRRERELRELHRRVSRARDRLLRLNEIMNDLMRVKESKAVLEIASMEAARIFGEIETICYEMEGESVKEVGGRCGNGIPLIISVKTSEAEYRFHIYTRRDLSEDQMSMLEIFFSITAAVAENRELWGQVEDSYFYMTQKLSEISEVYDDETGKHIKRVGEYSALLADELGMDKDYVEKIRAFSQLHDIGKLRVPREILTKPDKLTPEEFEIMKKHTIFGAEFIGEQPWLKMARNIALYHHENWDGTGYPFGLKGEEIPLEARIVKIADVYDALRSSRRYKPSFSHQEAMRIILEGDGKTMPSHFDPHLLEVFERVHLRFNEIFELNRD